MHTKSQISAAALAVALLATPSLVLAQGLDLNVDLGIVGVDATVGIGGDKLLDVDAGVNLGGSDGLDVNAAVGVGGDESSLVDLDAGRPSPAASPTGPNGGALIDLNIGRSAAAPLAVDLDILPRTTGAGSGLITGDIRLGSLSGDTARGDALLDLIASPNLADIDLDAAIDDRRVAITALADLLGPERRAEVSAAITAGGEGRAELLTALSASVELGTILGDRGIALYDVIAIQIAENGAAELFVLDDTVAVALLGDDGNLAKARIGNLAAIDLSLVTTDDADTDTGTGGDGSDSDPGPGNGSDDGTDPDTTPAPNPGTGGSSDSPAANLPATPVGASFPIAALGCDIGVLALAGAPEASAGAIASADMLELVRIEGCQRSLVDAEIDTLRAALAANPAVAAVLDQASIPLDTVIGATVQAGTLTVFIAPVRA